MGNIRTAHYQYKCRLCGEIYDYCCGGEDKTKNLLEVINIMEKGYDDSNNVKIRQTEIHAYCLKGNAIGIGDFIGIKYT